MLSGRIWERLTRSGSPSSNKMGSKRLFPQLGQLREEASLRQTAEKVARRFAFDDPARIATDIVVASAQRGQLDVYLRQRGQQSRNARALFLRVDADMDWTWLVFRHNIHPVSRLQAFSSRSRIAGPL